MKVRRLFLALVPMASSSCSASHQGVVRDPQEAIEQSARLAWVEVQQGIQGCMKKQGYTYFPVSPPKEATPGFVFPAVTSADFSQLGKHGYGLARSFETAVHHEQTDQNSAVIKAFSDYERTLYGSAKMVCIKKIPVASGPQKLLTTIAAQRTQWLSDPGLANEWSAWRECMAKPGVRVSRRDESLLFWAQAKLEEMAVAQRLQLNPPNEESLQFAQRIERDLSKQDISCLSTSGLPASRRRWGNKVNCSERCNAGFC